MKRHYALGLPVVDGPRSHSDLESTSEITDSEIAIAAQRDPDYAADLYTWQQAEEGDRD